MRTHAFPLHRRKLSVRQAYGLSAGIIAAASALVIGAMVTAWVAHRESFGRSLVAAAVSVAAAFGQTGVAVSIGVSIARNAVDNNGKRIRLAPKKIVSGPSNVFQAETLLKSVLRSGTADNDINAIKNNGSIPDGYTLMLDASSFAVNPSLYNKLPYDSLKAFKPIGVVLPQGPAPVMLGAQPLPERGWDSSRAQSN